jgi:hypothetical protein
MGLMSSVGSDSDLEIKSLDQVNMKLEIVKMYIRVVTLLSNII